MAKAKRKPSNRNGTNGSVLKRSKALLSTPILAGIEGTPVFVPLDQRSSVITPERVEWWKRSRFQPIRTLTPDVLSRQLDDFSAGFLRQFALTMDAIERRDDKLASVIPKRKSAVKRHGYQILIDERYEDDPEAEDHKEKLEYFWSHMESTNAVDLNVRGSFGLLVEQMMDCIGKRYAAHELLWRPSPEGLTCTFNFVPLWFFENLRGCLAFLKNDLDYYGVSLDPGAWMITCGQGAMEACAVAYMFKRLPLQDWLRYCEKHGMPGIVGRTNAALNSPQWVAIKDAVTAVAADFSAVISKEEEIEKIDFAADGQIPYKDIVDRMDRAMVEIWRGGDLQTMSHQGTGEGTGASLQGDEGDNLEKDDAKSISETLNMQIERKVIEYYFGQGVLPKAYISIVIPDKPDLAKEIQTDQFLISNGVKLGVANALERYGREEAAKGEDTLEPQAPPAMEGGINGGPGAQKRAPGNRGAGKGKPGKAGNARFAANEAKTAEYNRQIIETAADQLAQAQSEALEPLRHRIAGILEMPNEETFRAAVARLRRDLPGILAEVNQDPETAEPIAAAMASFFFNKLAEGVVFRHKEQEARQQSRANEGFEEEEHPRANDGKFTAKVAADLYKLSEKCPVEPDGSRQCHQSVAAIKEALPTYDHKPWDKGIKGDPGFKKDIHVHEWKEEKWADVAFELLRDHQTISKFKSAEVRNLLSDIADQSVNGHSFVTFRGRSIDPYLKSKGVPQSEIDEVGKYLATVYKRVGILANEDHGSDGGGDNCGTGAGGFQPGNTCAAKAQAAKDEARYERAIKNQTKADLAIEKMVKEQSVPTVDRETAEEKAQMAAYKAAKQKEADEKFTVAPKASLSETGAVPPLAKTETVDTSKWPAHNTAAKWGANKIAMMEALAKNGEWAKLKAIDTVPKSEQPNKYQKAVHEAYQKLTAQQEAPVAAAPAAPSSTGHPLAEVDTTGWKKVGGKLGSNEGGVYQDSSGQQWYVKPQKDENHALNEKLAAELYKVAGSPVPTVMLANIDGNLGTASKMEKLYSKGGEVIPFNPNEFGHAASAMKQFGVHAWLANWDAIGLNNDNQVWTGGGLHGVAQLKTIDVGGSLLYRAQGEPKGAAFGTTVNEWDNLRNPAISPQAAKVFGPMTHDALKEAAATVAAVPNSVIANLVNKYGPGKQAAKDALTGQLISRKFDLKAKADALGQPTAPKVQAEQPKNPGQQGPSVAPKVPPPPQVQTSTNPGAQPKLNAIHAAALTGQISAVEMINTSATTKNTYGKKAHDYKMQVLAAMKAGGAASVADAPKVAAPAIVAPHQKATPSLKVTAAELPSDPEFISKNAANVEANKLQIAKIKELAIAGKFDQISAIPHGPSDKVNAYKQSVLNVLHDKLNPPLPDTSAKKFGGVLSALDKAAPIVKDINAGYRVGFYVVAGEPGVVDHGYGAGKQYTAAELKSEVHRSAFEKLTSAEQQLIRNHTGSTNQDPFWQGKPGPTEVLFGKAVMKAAQPLPEGMFLSRKISLDDKVIAKLKNSVGKVLQEPANTSNSISAGVWTGNVHLKMVVGPGVKGLYVGSPGTKGAHKTISGVGSEKEVIMPPNTRFLVQKVEYNKDLVGYHEGKLIVHALILPTHDSQIPEAYIKKV